MRAMMYRFSHQEVHSAMFAVLVWGRNSIWRDLRLTPSWSVG